MLLASVGSLPTRGDPERYPRSHIEYWLRELLQLGYKVIGTGEPGGLRRYGMIERFTQDLGGLEVRQMGAQYKTVVAGSIEPPRNLPAVSEVVENQLLRSLMDQPEVRVKATVTDPVTIALELLANTPGAGRTHPDIFWEVTCALKPIVEALGHIVDIIQFDCPSHLYQPTSQPWRYVNSLVEHTAGKPVWMHVDGPVGRSWRDLVGQYRVDTIVLNIFGAEEADNFTALKEGRRDLNDAGKRIGACVVKSQIRDEPAQVESLSSVESRLRRLNIALEGDRSLVEALLPGCGLALLRNTAQPILELLPLAARESGWLQT